ncbi:MAG: hypothetical protein AAF633_06220, partial [Chloroflexota bacterium]
TAEVEQTLIPRAVPENIGQSEERYDSHIQGDVVFPDFMALNLRFEAASNMPPISLEQVGNETYLIEGDDRTLIENPLESTLPVGSDNFIGYLYAAENVQESPSSDHPDITIYTFDINGEAYANYVARTIRENLPPEKQGAIISPAPMLKAMTGSGELWLDQDGVPRRQILNTNVPEVNARYSARSEMVITFGYEEDLLDGALTALATPNKGATGLLPASSFTLPEVAANRFTSAERVSISLIVLLISASLGALTLAVIRQRRWIHISIPFSLAGFTFLTPVLTPIALANTASHRPQAVSLNEALGFEAETEEVETASTSIEENKPYVPELAPEAPLQQTSSGVNEDQCGSGNTVDDSDSDGLTDFVERCLGTSLFSLDTDLDLLTDTLEVEGFTLNGQTWYSNPMLEDSNGDGLTDREEWVAPIGFASSHDIDGDGLPNIWDRDNDGDGIEDEIDFDPFLVSEYQTSFSFESTLDEDDFDGYQYIEFQVQPLDDDHLRYITTPLDWSYDTEGNLQDRDRSLEDIQLSPALKVRTTTPPSEQDRSDYGLGAFNLDARYYSRFQDGDRYDMYIVLSPINDGGRITAFEGRAVYGPEEIDAIDWTSIEMVWTAAMENDSLNDDDEIETDTIILTEYTEPSFRITGMQVTKSGSADFAIFGTPNSPTSNRDLFQLIFGLEASYLQALSPTLDQLVRRFNNINSPIEETWGLDPADVAAVSNDKRLNNIDEFIAEAATALSLFMTNNYDENAGEMVSAVLAHEYDIGISTLEDIYDSSSSTLSYNLANIPISTVRSVKMYNAEYDGSGWNTLDVEEVSTNLLERYSDFSSQLADLESLYPELIEADLYLILLHYTIYWSFGDQHTIARFDGVELLDDAADDSSIYANLDLDGLDAITDESVFIGESQGIFVIERSVFWREKTVGAAIWQGTLGIGRAAYSMYLIYSGFAYKTVAFGLSWAEDVAWYGDKIASALSRGASSADEATTAVGKFALRNKAVIGKVVKVLGVALAIALLIYEIYSIWSARGEFSSVYDYEEDYATAYAITATVLAVVFFLLSFTVFGAVLVAAIALATIIVYYISAAVDGEGFDFTAEFTKFLTELFFSVEAYTTILDFDFEGLDLDFEGDFTEGAKVTLEDEFIGVINRDSGSDNSQLEQSDIYGFFSTTSKTLLFSSAFDYDYSTSIIGGDDDSRCDFTYYVKKGDRNAEDPNDRVNWYYENTRVCENVLQAEFTFNEASPNIPIYLLYNVYADTRYEECKTFRSPRCKNKTETVELPQELDDDDKWEEFELIFDIIPDDLDDLWTWSSVTNRDPDGDGLNATEEAELGTSTTLWDTDGDGLSDDFEAETSDQLGADPTLADTDGDGLLDGEEYYASTSIDDKDSDDDGLEDDEEVLQYNSNTNTWSGGGWTIDVNGSSYWVFTSPLNPDFDRDGILDGSEKTNGTSPNGTNDAPEVIISSSKVTSPSGERAIFVKSGSTFTTSVTINNIGSAPIADVVELCLPSTVASSSVVTSGDTTPTPTQVDDCYEWDFSTDNLELFQSFTVDLTGTGGSSTSVSDIVATLPYEIDGSTRPISLSVPYVEDNTPPTVSLTSPTADDLLNGDFYVMGGYAADADSWVTLIEVTAPIGDGSTTVTEAATGTANWAYTWELPDDGSVTPSVVATDYVGNVSLVDSATVTVDSLGPAISINISDNQTIASSESLSTTIQLNGTVTDNFAGISDILFQVNDRPWQTLWSGSELTPTLSANWEGEWNLGSLSRAQGEHKVRILAYDQFNNTTLLERTVLVDLLPPTSELTNRNFTGDDAPHVPLNQPLDLFGFANDAGNNPAAPGPVALEGTLNSIDDATVWLQIDEVEDNDAGVTVTWVGDVNGDRFGDLAVGLPAAGDGDGLVVVVPGRAGDWPNPKLDEVEALIDSRPSYVGDLDAGIGQYVQPAGDFNGDGIDDMLIADLTNGTLYLVFGIPSGNVFYRPLVPEDTIAYAELILRDSAGTGESLTGNFASAGDINGDGLSDILISTTSATGGKVYLLLGERFFNEDQQVDFSSAAVIETSASGAAVAGVGDVTGDFIDDFTVAFDGSVYLFAGGGSYAPAGLTPISTSSALATFATSDALPTIVGNGDMNNDGLGDFAYSNGSAPTVVFGSDAVSFGTQALGGFASELSGFLAGVGDVNKDGLSDLLIGNAAGDAYLIHGNSFSTVAATLEGVATAASAPYVAGADLVGDGSSDLLVVPSADLSSQFGFDSSSLATQPLINSSMVPASAAAPTTVGQPAVNTTSNNQINSITQFQVVSTEIMTGDVTVGDGVGYDYSTIQAAIDDVDAERVLVDSGLYAENLVLRNGVDIIGISGNPDDTIITFPNGGTNVLIDAAGVSDLTIALVSLLGDESSGSDVGLQVTGTTANLRIEGSLLQEFGTAISQVGTGANLEIINNTIVENIAGVSATSCAPIVVRNTIMALNTGTGLSYDACAATQSHTYNLYFSNGTD